MQQFPNVVRTSDLCSQATPRTSELGSQVTPRSSSSHQLQKGSPTHDSIQARILKSPSPLRPTAAKTPDRSARPPPSVPSSIVQEAAPSTATDKLTQVTNELRELKAMYRKVVEAHRSLRADYRVSEDSRYAAEQRANAAERELVACSKVTTAPHPDEVSAEAAPVQSAHIQRLCDEAKHASTQTAALWKAIADVVEAPVLLALRTSDSEARAQADTNRERQQRSALWEALQEAVDANTFAAVAQKLNGSSGPQPALPVSVARRLFEASDGAKAGDGTPRGPKPGDGTPRQSVGGYRAPPLPSSGSTSGATHRRLSLPAASSGMCATPGRARGDAADGVTCSDARQPEMTPTRTFPGGLITATPQSASVRDRIRALESSGRKE